MPRKRKKLKKKKDILTLVIKINTAILAGTLMFYLLLGLFFDPSFFKQDLLEKYVWAVGSETTVSLQIINSPPLSVAEPPILDFGGGLTVTAKDILSGLSWVVILLLILLILFLSLLLLEYLLAKQRIYKIDESNLKKGSYIS